MMEPYTEVWWVASWHTGTGQRKDVQRAARTAKKIVECRRKIFQTRSQNKASSIIRDHNHPGHQLFSLLWSGRCYWSIRTRSSRLKNSLYSHWWSSLLNHRTYSCTGNWATWLSVHCSGHCSFSLLLVQYHFFSFFVINIMLALSLYCSLVTFLHCFAPPTIIFEY